MLTISDFMRDFHQTLYNVAPEEVKRDITKQERIVKHTLYMVMGQHEHFNAKDAAHFQERFHVRMDQMASDYQTWKRAGCKTYAKPKQYVTGRVAGASKKAFDQVLNTYLLRAKEQIFNKKEEDSFIKRAVESFEPKGDILEMPELGA